MTVTPHSVCIVAPQARWDDIRSLWQAYGYELGDGVEMSPTGNAPTTHRGAHMWLTVQQALDFTGRPSIIVPAGYNLWQVASVLQQFRVVENGVETDHGGPPPATKAANCSIDFKPNGGTLTKRQHFDAVLATRGWQVIESDPLSGLAAETISTRRP